MNRRTCLALAGSAIPVVSGCLGDEEADMSEEDVVETIDTQQSGFEPATVSIEAGEGVEWVNVDSTEHEIISSSMHDEASDWNFEQTLAPEESDFFVFQEEGIYDFECGVHTKTFMCGTIFVGDYDETEDHLACK